MAKKEAHNKKTILIGPCDITAISTFLVHRRMDIFDINNCGTYNTCLSSYWIDSINNNKNKSRFISPCCYPDWNQLCKNTSTIVMSLLLEPQLGLYKNRKNGSSIIFGYPHIDARMHYNDYYKNDVCVFGKEAFLELKDNYDFIGVIKPKEVVNNYKKIIEKIDCRISICILLGPTFDSKYGEQNIFYQQFDIKAYFSELNGLMKETFESEKRVWLLDPYCYYKQPKNKLDIFYYGFPSISHYPRITYSKIAYILSRRYKGISFNYLYYIYKKLKRLLKLKHKYKKQ